LTGGRRMYVLRLRYPRSEIWNPVSDLSPLLMVTVEGVVPICLVFGVSPCFPPPLSAFLYLPFHPFPSEETFLMLTMMHY
jgi:hypothetical protein